jgi:putative membrane protein
VSRQADGGEDDASRRTVLAAERTWLAWWRTGIAAATASVAVGGVVPELVGDGRTAYVVLGAGYAALALVAFAAAGLRQRGLVRAVRRGGIEPVPATWVVGFTVAGMALALATLAVVVVQP